MQAGRIGAAVSFRAVNCVMTSADHDEEINRAGSSGNGASCPFSMRAADGDQREKYFAQRFPGKRCSEFFGAHGFPFFFAGLGNLREEQDALQRALGTQRLNHSVEDLRSVC